MELRQLRYALALAEHRHFGRAARSLGITQPTLSRRLAALEQELGTSLFDRTSDGVFPTAAGEVWTANARRVLAQVDRGADDARRAARGHRGTLRLAFVGSALVQLLPSLLARFRGTHPAIGLECMELASTHSTAALLAGTVDVAVSRGAPRGRGAETLTSVPVGHDQLVALCHRSHPFASQPAVTVDQLRGEPLVTTTGSEEPATVEHLDAVLDGRDPIHPTTSARDIHTITGLVACGVGIGLLPSCARALCRPETAVVEIRPALRLPDLCLVTRTDDDSPTVGAFLDVTAEHCPDVSTALRRRTAGGG
ncbi:LysR family transcriptional regulator [Pseudonocardia sp. EC080610-09]|uniref:LysR family transcriptional regulator n=1 Tax=unclassified Pseudonocardia TaxID=2619320 RepID=UPI0006CB1E5E|nr:MULTISPECIES: LysR family transcriptional regulator [unclassified Pseudonocardia]ALE72574.1 LysR family transcriptional regulator [Pseudonocardia sp. EC080625-04]ALL75889.1 LysR family transcriptional regulator [Pseudonocardia sp. EC080610-09]ALL82916.1 LysR family transcriptional regulator [Pseudonocardia sp. EC080619-01]